MATLEMVRLRSKYPNTGRMTIRHPMPLIDAPMGDLMGETATEATTAPQVVAPNEDGETTAREGRHAR